MLKDILATSTKQWQPIDANLFFMLDDIKVWACPDFAYTDASSILHIIDWKTGKEHPAQLRLQLACYALYAMKKYQLPLEKITLGGVILNDGGRLSPYGISQENLVAATDQMLKSACAMRGKLQDVAANTAVEEEFDCTANPAFCANCPYRQVCPQAGGAMPQE